MARPQFLMRRQDGYQRPQTFYRSFVSRYSYDASADDDDDDDDDAQVDQCYGLLCELGINGLINRMSRMINNY